MTSKSTLKTNWLPIASLSVAIIGGALGYWRSSSASELQSTLTAKEAEAQRIADNVRYGQKLDVQIARLEQINEELAGRLTDPADLAANQQYFYKMESAAGVKITDLRQIGLPKKKAGTAIFAPVPYIITATGEYAQVMTFLQSLESGARLCRVTTAGLSLGRGKVESPTAVTVTLNLELVRAL
jgi:hypothetical protein